VPAERADEPPPSPPADEPRVSPPADEPPPSPPADEPRPSPPADEPRDEPVAAGPHPERDAEAEREPAAEVRTLTPVADRPLPPRRVPAARRPPPRNTRRPRPRTATATRPPHRWRRRIVAVGAFAALIAVVVLAYATFEPLHGGGSGTVRVTIPQGANAGTIGDILASRGVVDNATLFQLNATITGRRGGLRPGHYTLEKGMSYGAAIAALEKGPKAKIVKTVNVTLPEGPSVHEMAPVVDHSGKVRGAYLKAATSAKVMRRVHRLGAPKRVHTPEGFLFPATYTLVADSPARDLVAKQLQAFKTNVAKVNLGYARSKNLTRYDVLIIASMIEREAQKASERPLIAAVIYNRLHDGMPLGIDATIRYATHNWTRPILESQLKANEPYNTRLNQGLPPTPIGNPGLASIQAAAHPAHKGYLFYVVKPGTCGEHAFSSTDAQFARDLQRYNAARAAAGGRSPTRC
jgi:uncharacterized YceG family protein